MERRGYAVTTRIAYHEAGHVVADYLSGLTVVDATIDGSEADGVAGRTSIDEDLCPEDLRLLGEGDRERVATDFVRALFAGGLAAELATGEESVGDSHEDAVGIRTLTEVLIPSDCHDWQERRANWQAQIRIRAREWLQTPVVNALVGAVANALIQRRTLDGNAIASLIESELSKQEGESEIRAEIRHAGTYYKKLCADLARER